MAIEGSGFCIHCGARLEAVHRFCWTCGAARWSPETQPAPAAPEPERAPPTPGTSVFNPRPAAAVPPVTSLGLPPRCDPAGALLFLAEATPLLAYLPVPA